MATIEERVALIKEKRDSAAILENRANELWREALEIEQQLQTEQNPSFHYDYLAPDYCKPSKLPKDWGQ